MANLKDAIKECLNRMNKGNINPFTPYEINEIWHTLMCFRDGSSLCETINQNVMTFFKSYDFKVTPRGIGYQIKAQ